MFDGKIFGKEVVGVVKDYVAGALIPLLNRLDAMEQKLAALPAPKDGKDADPEAVASIVMEKMAEKLEELRAAVEAIPEAPELPDIPAMIKEAVDALPAPQDGKSVTPDDVAPLIEESVSKAVSALPKAKDGQPGKDGVGAAGAMIDRSGNLVLTLTDGTTRELGIVVGKDGDPGKPGRDGFSLKDFDASLLEDGRTVLLSFEQGEIKHSIELGFPAMIYRGVYKDGQSYDRGDTVTWGGSLWHRDEDGATEKPDGGKSWTLAAKRGRDGKDGVVKDAPSGKVKI